jgi:hypothetical protein
MKLPQTSLLFATLLFLSISVEAQTPGIRGAYTLVKQSINSGNGDSAMANEQMKLFTDKHMIYAHKRQDTLAGFGVGTYSGASGKVIESVFYGNNGAKKNNYELKISKIPGGYRQVIEMKETGGRNFILTEDYKNVGKQVNTPLDGAWKLVKVESTSKDGKKTVEENRRQFKVYESGNFVWAATYKDTAAGQRNSAFGYGAFEMTSPTKAVETNINSSYSSLLGTPVTLTIKLVGKDMFEQSINWENGMKEKEIYQRLR